MNEEKLTKKRRKMNSLIIKNYRHSSLKIILTHFESAAEQIEAGNVSQ